jgi:hypothetical protein
VAAPIIGNVLRFVFFLATGGRSSNGRTPDSESGYLGSNPSLPAKSSSLLLSSLHSGTRIPTPGGAGILAKKTATIPMAATTQFNSNASL